MFTQYTINLTFWGYTKHAHMKTNTLHLENTSSNWIRENTTVRDNLKTSIEVIWISTIPQSISKHPCIHYFMKLTNFSSNGLVWLTGSHRPPLLSQHRGTKPPLPPTTPRTEKAKNSFHYIRAFSHTHRCVTEMHLPEEFLTFSFKC